MICTLHVNVVCIFCIRRCGLGGQKQQNVPLEKSAETLVYISFVIKWLKS
jgi:hypothetical protein